MSEESERREGFGEMRAEVRNLGKKLDDLSDEIREDRKLMWGEINTSRTDIATAKGIGKVMHVVWMATVGSIIAYLWGSHK